MIGWSIGFLAIAAVAAFLGFGGIATAFAGVAQLIFFVALALLLLSLLFGALPRERVSGGVRGLGVLAIGALVGIGVYLWVENDMNAEHVGRSIDRSAVQIANNAEEAADRATEVVESAISDTRNDAADTIDTDDRE